MLVLKSHFIFLFLQFALKRIHLQNGSPNFLGIFKLSTINNFHILLLVAEVYGVILGVICQRIFCFGLFYTLTIFDIHPTSKFNVLHFPFLGAVHYLILFPFFPQYIREII